jgi:NDP-sugar pyrophosphorylase family protein
MQVMLLAAGRSTRLGPLGAVLPKPLVPICGYPAIAFGLALCRRADLRDVVINTYHHGRQIEKAIGDGSAFGVSVRYSREETLLGTGGGIARARTLFRSEPVLVMNAKVVADIDLRAVIAAHEAAPRDRVATMVVREDPHLEKWSSLLVDATGALAGLRGQRRDRTPVGPLGERMFTGIHILEPALLDRLPAGESDVVDAAYIPALLEGQRIGCLSVDGYFAEHSTPADYLKGNLDLLATPALLRHPPGPLTGIDDTARVHASASIVAPVRIGPGSVVESGAVVGPNAVIGSGVRIGTGVRVESAVVWAGALVRRDVHREVVVPVPIRS